MSTFLDRDTKAQTDGRLRQAQLKMLAMLKVVDKICQKYDLDYWLEGGTLLGAIRHQGFIPWDDDLDISMPRASFEKFLELAPQEIPETVLLQTPKTDPGYFNLSVPLKIRDRNSRFIDTHELGNEPYHQGIFIDVFVYDYLPENSIKRSLLKTKANKILRLLNCKHSQVATGHYAKIYRVLSYLFSQNRLEKSLHKAIVKTNKTKGNYLGYGLDCVNRGLLTYQDIYPLQRVFFEGLECNIIKNPEAILNRLYGDYMVLPPENERVMKHCKELIPFLVK